MLHLVCIQQCQSIFKKFLVWAIDIRSEILGGLIGAQLHKRIFNEMRPSLNYCEFLRDSSLAVFEALPAPGCSGLRWQHLEPPFIEANRTYYI